MPEQPDDPWLPGETAPTDGTRFLSCTVAGEVEICRHRVAVYFHYQTLEHDPGHPRVIRRDEPWWDPHPPALWRPLPRTSSYGELSEARQIEAVAGQGREVERAERTRIVAYLRLAAEAYGKEASEALLIEAEELEGSFPDLPTEIDTLALAAPPAEEPQRAR